MFYMKMNKMMILVMFFLLMLICLGQGKVFAGDNPAGKIIETMNSAGYSYALIEKHGVKTWVAVPQMQLGVGDEVEFVGGLAMGEYVSNTLGRTFDDIIFSSGVVSLKRAEKFDEPESAAEKIIVEKATGPDAYTISELYAQKTALVSKRVVVRGKVYKVSKFMGVTWIRIKDGSGSRKKGNHKLIVTSSETAKKGDVVTVAGILAVDKKLSGLSFDVVVEHATILL